EGIISSALYVDLPDKNFLKDHAGWLQLGAAPPDMRLPELQPLFEIEPKIGRLALFPSTLYHGTRRFESGTRMTVAYDVALQDYSIARKG
ncbi:MAG: putative 2OG-Fe(II) oxygenase, partial [Sphingomonadaceae bacterium]